MERSNMKNSYSEAPLMALRYGCAERYGGLILVHLLNANALEGTAKVGNGGILGKLSVVRFSSLLVRRGNVTTD